MVIVVCPISSCTAARERVPKIVPVEVLDTCTRQRRHENPAHEVLRIEWRLARLARKDPPALEPARKARRTSRTVSFMGFWHGQERRHVPACARRTLTTEGVQARQLTTPSVAALRSRSAFTLNLISSPRFVHPRVTLLARAPERPCP